jgi:ammonium transporter, Amt family
MTPTPAELAKQVADLQVSINLVWTLIAAFLVMFMQAGFALVETGLTRAKNAAHTMAMNILVYAIGIIGFWAIGFGLQMGGVGALATFGGETTLSSEFALHFGTKVFGLFGTSGFFLSPSIFTPAVAATFLFQMVFMDTAATIPTGALAERWKLTAFVLFSFIAVTLIYPVYANWVWGGGWLSQLGTNFGLGHGHVDFAGSSVVHMTGGVMAFVGMRHLGARAGKFGKDGTIHPMPGHSVPMVVLGTIILAFGWFGFNAGSTLAGTDSQIAIIATNTMIASAGGGLTAYLYLQVRYGKPDVTLVCNGLLGGLVAITAPCAFVGASEAALIGGIAGVLAVVAAVFVERKLRLDDPVGAVAVHGANGIFGILAVGLFANGTYGDGLNNVPGRVVGLFHGGGFGQLGAQCIGIAANIVYVGAVASLGMWIVGKICGSRSTPEDEFAGLDLGEVGVAGYGTDGGHQLSPEATTMVR